ncbi:MAG: FkbM family methyltransferase [Alphaproteobacteria bacterium]
MAAAATPRTWGAFSKGVLATMDHRAALERFQFGSVIDIGANKGQFAAFAMASWPQAKLFCFEPLPGPREKLKAVTARRATVFDCALGQEESTATMHVASRADSSSLLPLGERQKAMFQMSEASVLNVPVRRLDNVLNAGMLTGPTLMKIDVQGFERDVLRGGIGLLPAIDAIYVELSFVELYDNQALAGEITDLLGVEKFKLAGVYNQMCDGQGEAVQADFLFLARR